MLQFMLIYIICLLLSWLILRFLLVLGNDVLDDWSFLVIIFVLMIPFVNLFFSILIFVVESNLDDKSLLQKFFFVKKD